MTASDATGPTLTRRLARLVRGKTARGEDLRQAELYVRDWLGSFVAGRATEPGRALVAYGGGLRDLESRVFLAAALSHITETDDLHRTSVTHPGCVVVPTALLLGLEEGRRGEEVLRAVLAGFEVMIRIGDALGPGHYRVFHNTATAGVFGAAATAASLLGLDEDEWCWALGNAGTQAAGLWEFQADGAMSKHLHPGHAASAGLRAALLARAGFTGPATILEGDRGFFRGYCPDPDPGAVLADASGWRLGETSLKPYPCCRHTHPAIDAALEVRRSLRARGADDTPERVEVRTYEAALRVTDQPRPRTSYDAKFSLQFCVAEALLSGKVTLDSFEERLGDVAVRDLASRIRLAPSPELESAYPERWGAEVAVHLPGGGKEKAVRDTARGDPEARLTEEEVQEKLRGLLEYGGVPETEGEELLAASRALADDGPVFPLPWPGAGTERS